MSLQHSPSIVTNGLVMYYDMANTARSFKGMPTTNLIGNPNSGINITSSDVPAGVQVPGYFSTSSGYNVIDWSVTPTAATGGTFTSSVYMRSPGGVSTYLMYIYTGTGPDGGWYGPASGALTSSWQRYSGAISGYTGTISTMRIYRVNSLGTIEIAAPQLEATSFATPFIYGTRSNTQAILDLTNNNTLTATNLAYASDNTFSFSGSNSYITAPSSSTVAFGAGDFTIGCWIYPSTVSGYTHMIALPDQGTFALKSETGTGNIYFYTPGWTSYGSTPGWTLTANAWNYVVFTRSASVGYAYLNGVSYGSKTGFTNSFTAQILNIHNGWLTEFVDCKLPTAQIYNRALTATEVAQNFNALRSRYGI